MKALVLEACGSLSYREVPDPALAPDEVLVAVRACGICGSDVHGMDGSTGRRRPPIIMGHEAAGLIAACGPAVRDWREGDRVTFDSTLYCGQCMDCRAGRINLCADRRVLGVSCAEYRRDGAMAEYVAVPQRVLHRLPEELDFVQAAFAEPVSVALHAVRRAGARPGESALVLGAGMIGLLLVQALGHAGCSPLLAVDLDPARAAQACSLGAHHGLSGSRADTLEQVRAITQGGGVDHVFDVVGAAETVETACALCRKGGTVTLIGNLAPAATLPLQSVVTREITLRGSCASCGEYPASLALLAAGDIKVGPLLSATAPLSEGAEWFRRLYGREPGLLKVVLCPGLD
jgi:L-iditol 2-dehydrogenase